MKKFLLPAVMFCAVLFAQELIVNQEFTPSNMQKTQSMGW